MNAKIRISALLSVTLLLCGFSVRKTIEKCYIDFNDNKGLTASAPEKIADASKNSRQVQTSKGKVSITREEMVKVDYKNEKGSVFATIEVEVSDAKLYSYDTAQVAEHLKYLTTMRKDLDTKGLKELSYNGYKIYGIRSNNTESDNKFLGIYAMFPENGIIVYVFFHKLDHKLRNYENLTDFQAKSNAFLGNYTAYLKKCRGK
ncbi:MAG: hypothetical protein ACXVPQ_07860 [Bacteroidia bacterium]